ncbi:MAG: SAM-dependent methyltransferase [Chloroflexota bacterium]|nr:SAM-dependent methyltransferase [Chloroflexota bacterium]
MTGPIDRPTLAQPGYRREELPDPESVGEDEGLVAAIRAEIETTGPITFARFMERALYEPGHGYYRRPEAGPGIAGDFLTAPEAHPIFGAAIGRLLEQAWEAMGRPSPFTVSEPGAGSGALAAGLLGGLRDLGSPLLAAIRYRPVELELARVAAFRARLAGEGLDGYVEAGDLPEGPVETGAVVANEVIDALPVHRVVGRQGRIRELLVGVADGGGFESVEGVPTTPALAERLASEGVTLADGQAAEVCLAVDAWLERVVRHLRTGVVVLVDYADEPAALHGPARMTGTLRVFARHAVGADPFRHVGRQDLTATVDLGAVRVAAIRAGLHPLGETTQAELLAAVGSVELTDAWLRRPGADLQGALLLRSAVARLMDPHGMGGYRVLVFGRGLPTGMTLPGLARTRRPGSPS